MRQNDEDGSPTNRPEPCFAFPPLGHSMAAWRYFELTGVLFNRLCRQHIQVDEDSDGHNVEKHMQRIWADAVALGQKGMCGCVHRLIASDLLWIGAK
jgi:hypothetical protein